MSDVTPQPIELTVFKPAAALQYADQATVDRTRLDYWQSCVNLEGLNTDSTHQAAVQGQYLGTYVTSRLRQNRKRSMDAQPSWSVSRQGEAMSNLHKRKQAFLAGRRCGNKGLYQLIRNMKLEALHQQYLSKGPKRHGQWWK